MNFKSLISKYFSGNSSDSDLPSIGVVAMLEGYDSLSLLILAGLDKNENGFAKEKYFRLAVEELLLKIPNKREACLRYALAISQDILSGQIEIISGVSEIFQKALYNHDFYSENINFVYDSINMEMVYGLYIEYDDLEQEQIPGDGSKDKIAMEIKQQLMSELTIWTKKMQLSYDDI